MNVILSRAIRLTTTHHVRIRSCTSYVLYKQLPPPSDIVSQNGIPIS
jgi:hypothetical protein